MMTLAAEKRDPEVKAKKLRREGYSTGVLYGREMKENVSLKYTEKDALNFIKKSKRGCADHAGYLRRKGRCPGKRILIMIHSARRFWLWISRHWLQARLLLQLFRLPL